MKKISVRLLSGLLALMLAVTSVGVEAFAVENTGSENAEISAEAENIEISESDNDSATSDSEDNMEETDEEDSVGDDDTENPENAEENSGESGEDEDENNQEDENSEEELGEDEDSELDEESEESEDSEKDPDALKDEKEKKKETGEEVESEYVEPELATGYVVTEADNDVANTDEYADDEISLQSVLELPSEFKTETLPPLRDQNPYGTCWAHSAIACAEISMLKKGYSAAAATNYSELALAYFAYYTPDDPLKNTGKNTSSLISLGADHLNGGGNSEMSSRTLINWIGATQESKVPYSSASKSSKVDESFAFDDIAHLQNYFKVDIKDNRDAAKKMIMDYGALAISFDATSVGYSVFFNTDGTTTYKLSSSKAYNADTNAYWNGNGIAANGHAVTVVGWDDDFPAENFVPNENGGYPEENGAWLVRNSWMTENKGYFDNYSYYGYFWMSYYEPTLNASAYAYDYEPASNYEFIYQYDGGTASSLGTYDNNEVTVANVFTAKGAEQGETLDAVSFCTGKTNEKYEVKIYTNLEDETDPESGVLASTAVTSGHTFAEGYYTVPLNSKVRLNYGENFAIVITLQKKGYEVSVDGNYSGSNVFRSYEKKTDGTWKKSSYRLRIKGYTSTAETEAVSLTDIGFEDNIDTEDVKLSVGESYKTKPVFTPANADASGLIWSSSDESVATVDAGTVTGVEIGDAVITVSSPEGDVSASYIVHVVSGPSSVSIDYEKTSVNLGSVMKLGYTLVPSDAEATSVQWYTEDEDIVSVSSEGLVTPLKKGTACIHLLVDGRLEDELYIQVSMETPKLRKQLDADNTIHIFWDAAAFADYYEIIDPSGETHRFEPGQESYEYINTDFLDLDKSRTVQFRFVQHLGGEKSVTSCSFVLSDFCNITYEMGNGTNNPDNPTHYRNGTPIELKDPISPEGYYFLKWEVKENGSSKYEYYYSGADRKGDVTFRATFSPIYYYVYFNNNGGSGNISRIYTDYDAEFTLPEGTFTRKGYTFVNWNTRADGSGVSYEPGQKLKNISSVRADYVYIYAQWKPDTALVTFDPGEGSLEASELQKEVTFDSAYGTLPTPVRENYTFAGWYSNQSFSSSSQIGTLSKVSVAGNHTLYAKWTPKTLYILYNHNGGSGETKQKSATYGNKYTSSLLPTAYSGPTGYTFDGWYTEPVGGTKLVANVSVIDSSENITLYAHWIPKSIKVTFYNESSSQVYQKNINSDCSFGSAFSEGELPQISTATGKRFLGWYTSARGGGKRIDDDTLVRDVISSSATTLSLYAYVGSYSDSANVVVYKTNIINVTVSPSSQSVGTTYGKSPSGVSQNLPTPSWTGGDFLGWYTSPEGGTKITGTSTVSFTGTQTLYAHWSPKSYVVTFNENGGKTLSSTQASKTVYYGRTYGQLPVPERDGYTFAGWYSALTEGSRIYEDTKVSLTADSEIYARWNAGNYLLTCYVDGNVYSEKYYSSETAISLNSSVGTSYTPVGKKLLGWYTASSGGIKFENGSKISRDTKLYAVFTANDGITLFFKGNGAGAEVTPVSKNVTYGQPYGELPVPTRVGYNFVGWSTSSLAGTGNSNLVSEDTVCLSDNSRNLYAIWSPTEWTVSFNANGGDALEESRLQKTVRYGVTYGELPVPSKEGCIFSGWFTEENSGIEVTADTVFENLYDTVLYAHWKTAEINVTFKPNGGELAGSASKSVAYGEVYGEMPLATRTGYIFEGWYTASSDGTKVEADTVCRRVKDQILYARWKGKTIEVTFDPGDGAMSDKDIQTYSYGSAFGTFPEAVYEGYCLEGWYTTDGTEILPSTRVTSEVNITLHARWQKPSFTVTFDPVGGTVTPSSKVVDYYENYGELPVPQREKSVFDGWYTAKEGGEKITSDSRVRIEKNTTLFAHWSEEDLSIKVTFDANGGTPVTTELTVYNGGYYRNLPTTTREGYDFQGWYTQITGGTKISSGAKVEIEAPITLYAHWKAKTYTIYFSLNGGSGSSPSLRTVTYGSPYGNLPATSGFHRNGYTCTGWMLSDGTMVKSSTIVSTAESHILYAKWISTSYFTVTLDANGGTHPEAYSVYQTNPALLTLKVNGDGTYAESYVGSDMNEHLIDNVLPTPERKGYTFAGWYTEKTGGIRKNSDDEVTDSHTLYAHWEPLVFNLSFELNSEEGSIAPVQIAYGSTYGELPAPTRPGYEFVGWFDSSDFETANTVYSDTVFAPDIPGDMKLYAQWKLSEYQVAFNSNGGNPVEPATRMVGYNTCYGELPVPSRTGYEFAGWYKERYDSTEKVTAETVYRDKKDTILWAYWNPISISVSFDVNKAEVLPIEETIIVSYDSSFGNNKEGIALPVPEDVEGYEFVGWFTSVEGGNQITENSIVSQLSDCILYAHWALEEYEVVFRLNGGRLSHMDTVLYNFDYGTKLIEYNDGKYEYCEALKDMLEFQGTDKIESPERTKYIFDGWYTSATGGDRLELDIDEINSGATAPDITVKNDIFFYAHWTAKVDAIDPVFAVAPENQENRVYEDSRIILSTESVDTGIYYTTDGTEPTKRSRLYTGELIASKIMSADHKITLKAVAIKEDYGISNIAEFNCSVEKESDSWGEIIEEDRTMFPGGISDVPVGIWMTGLAEWYPGGEPDILYTGKNITFDNVIRVYNGKLLLKLGSDYTLSYKNNKKAGIGTVTVNGKNNYKGSVSKNFTILEAVPEPEPVRTPISTYKVVGLETSYPYKGENVEVIPTNIADITLERTVGKGADAITEVLDSGNYEITYKNNTKAGTATIIFTGVGAYSGTVSKNYKIAAQSLEDTERISVADIGEVPFIKSRTIPNPVVTFVRDDGNTDVLKSGVDYTLSYANNTKVNDGSDSKKMPVVTIKGKGNYTGSIKKEFTISGQEISAPGMILKINDKVYSNKKNGFVPQYTLADTNGDGKEKKLSPGTDFEKNILYTYEEDTDLDDGTVRMAGTEINPVDIVPIGTIVRMTFTGKGSYSGTISGTYRIIGADVSGAKVTIPTRYYTGSEIRPEKNLITVTVGKTVLSDEDYEIVSYANNINKGKASLTIRGVGNYGGSKTVNFTIDSKPMSNTVVFYGNGATSGNMKALTRPYGKTVKFAKNAYKKTGCVFMGWNTKADGTGVYYPDCFSEVVTDETPGEIIYLFAQWSPEVYTITYHLNGGNRKIFVYACEKADIDGKICYGISQDGESLWYTSETRSITFDNPYRELWPKGTYFGGWYKDAAFKNKITGVPKGSSGNIDLYAKWIAYNYSIAFDGNGATKGTMKSELMGYGEPKALTKGAFTRTGYAFVGWSTTQYEPDDVRLDSEDAVILSDKQAVTEKNLGIPTRNNSNARPVTLYAVWRSEFKISYNPDGGYVTEAAFEKAKESALKQGSILSGSAYVDENTGVLDATRYGVLTQNYFYGKGLKNTSIPTPSKAGYTFGGWYTDTNYKTKISSVGAKIGTDYVLYARWTPNKYTLVFDGNGKTGGKTSSIAGMPGESLTVATNGYVKKGYAFKEWNTSKDGKGQSYSAGDEFVFYPEKNGQKVTLYAIWR